MAKQKTALARCSSGQSMLETALILPVLLMLVFNAINFGYFFLVALNVATAPRSGVEYSIMGSSAPAGTGLPPATPGSTTITVAYLTYQDMIGALNAPANAKVQVCSKILGLNNAGTSSQTAKCSTCSSSSAACGAAGSGSPAPASDPENGASSQPFVLNRVDVTYQFNPIIPGTPFGIALLPASVCSSSGGKITCTFHRQVSMRAMD